MRRQSGFGLMVMLVVVVLAGTYVVINQLSAAGGQTAARRDHNARVLQQAKQPSLPGSPGQLQRSNL
jgi:hypothetical protein